MTLLPGFVEIRDKGLVKRKVLTKNKSFEKVLEEVESYFRYLGKRLAPGLLKDTLIKIGLPQVRLIIDEEDIIPESTPPQDTTTSAATGSLQETDSEPTLVESSPPVSITETRSEKLAREKTKHPVAAEPEAVESEVSVFIGDKELHDIREALEAVETLSDTFMAPTGKQTEDKSAPSKPQIKIEIQGIDEIVAAETSRATTSQSAANLEEVEVAEGNLESQDVIEIEESPEPVVEELEDVTAEHVPELTPDIPAHVVKPLVEAKALMLGEENVGKASLIAGASLGSVLTDDLSSPYMHDRVFELTNHRVKLYVWSFDEASEMKVPRHEFFASARALIIVYSAIERWSFQSIDFWLKESAAICDPLPPLLIVANKVDVRNEGKTRSGDRPVSKEEGFKMAEGLAKKHGQDGKLHSVAFIETSCVTGEGVEAVFRTAAELSLRWKPEEE